MRRGDSRGLIADLEAKRLPLPDTRLLRFLSRGAMADARAPLSGQVSTSDHRASRDRRRRRRAVRDARRRNRGR